jgi:hypothetical protein
MERVSPSVDKEELGVNICKFSSLMYSLEM